MKKGKLRIGDVFISKNKNTGSIYRIGIITEIQKNEDGNVCRLQSDPHHWCWIYSDGLRNLPVYEYAGHVDLDEEFRRMLSPFREQDSGEKES